MCKSHAKRLSQNIYQNVYKNEDKCHTNFKRYLRIRLKIVEILEILLNLGIFIQLTSLGKSLARAGESELPTY